LPKRTGPGRDRGGNSKGVTKEYRKKLRGKRAEKRPQGEKNKTFCPKQKRREKREQTNNKNRIAL